MSDEDFSVPAWMERYREHFASTGGNSIEELVEDIYGPGRDPHMVTTNLPRYILAVAVTSQMAMLESMRRAGLTCDACSFRRSVDEALNSGDGSYRP